MKLAGKVALVTGADSGIGQAIALTFAREGADVAIHYGHDRQGAEETARQVRAQGRRAAVLQADLADPRTAPQLVAQAVEALGGIDLLVCSAGTSSSGGGPLEDPLGDFVRLLNVDLVSPYARCQAAGRHMAERGRLSCAAMGRSVRRARPTLPRWCVRLLTGTTREACAPTVSVPASCRRSESRACSRRARVVRSC